MVTLFLSFGEIVQLIQAKVTIKKIFCRCLLRLILNPFHMNLIRISLLVVIAFGESFAQTKNQAHVIIETALNALGGREKIVNIQNLQFSGYGYHNALEQSERFEGPYIPSNFAFQNIFDFKDTLAQYASSEQVFTFQSKFKYLIDKSALALIVQGKPTPWPQDQTAQDDLFLNPLALLFRAERAPSLRLLGDSVVQRVPHKRILFSWNDHPVVISINSDTYLPTLVEIEKTYSDSFLGVWGDLKKVVHYSFWDLLDNGVHYPLQKDIYFMGKLWESSVITQIKINQPLLADSLRIPSAAKSAALDITKSTSVQLKKMMESKSEIAKDIWLIPGYCNSTVIRQSDGIVIVEAPNTSDNTDLIIEQVKSLFPTLPIKNIVTTSDAWLHCGGVRSAAANSSVVALKGNQAIIEELLQANYKSNPDRWQKMRKKKASITYVDKRSPFGTGVNRFEAIPYRTEAGERMMMVYFPQHKLLYASDLLQPGNWEKHYTLEVIQAVTREKLEVDLVYAMHMKPTKYQDILAQMKPYLPN